MPLRRTVFVTLTAATTAAIAAGLSCARKSSESSAPTTTVDTLVDESGFIDVVPQADGAPFPARMFYVFETADEQPASKPLAVFMAGGPGYPSSLDLLPYGIARATLASPTAPDPAPAHNPASWTSFANLLFIDERQSGFSYELDDGSGPGADAAVCSFTPLGDAADFVRAILGFLDAHPTLRSAPVVLVGQSYGGERATFVLDLLLRYPTEAPRADATLLATIQAHYDAVFPEHAGTVVDPALAVTQFGRVVLMQPFVLGGAQYSTQAAISPGDPYVGNVPVGRDPYDVRQDAGWSQSIDDTAATVLATFPEATSLLAIDPQSIPRLGPSARADAFRVTGPSDLAQEQTNAAWTAGLGRLDPADEYLVYPATACPFDASLFEGPGSESAFLANLQGGVRTFVTDARYDSVIYAPAIPKTLQTLASVSLDTAARPGVARPGWFTVAFSQDGGYADGGAATAGAADAGTTSAIEIRFPPYDDSGHFVALAQAQALHDDVAAWLLQDQ